MPGFTCHGNQNIYILSRLATGISRFDAAWKMHISDRTLARIENEDKTPEADLVLKMEDIYGDRILTARHCADICPIGIKYANRVETKDICAAVLSLVNGYNHLGLIRDRLIEIAADGIISPDEVPDFEKAMDELLDIEQEIDTIKMLAHSVINLESLIERRKKEKTPACVVAEPRAMYNI